MQTTKQRFDDSKGGCAGLSNGFHEKAEADCRKSEKATQPHKLKE
jgi:hypothetical protein